MKASAAMGALSFMEPYGERYSNIWSDDSGKIERMRNAESEVRGLSGRPWLS
jgi:hypothetical protein